MRARLLVPAVMLAASASAQVPEKADPAQLPNYNVVTRTLATAGQPSTEVLPKLGSLGFKTVINLRTPDEGAPDERAVVESQGLRYVSVPIKGASMTLADVAAVEKVLDDPQAGPILLHCATANRTGGVWAVIQARKGKSLEEALAAGRAAGMKSPVVEEAARRLATEAQAK
jgi:uncharacterized protein (TIGR01244 family)